MSELVSSRIHLLPEHLVDQIKAGEVIERPANLIKEILENSLDAQSKNISIHLIAGGMELIAIEDDGIGMSFSDLPYAFCRHATSKIDKFEDLYKLGSYGFRGEALASIASISRVTCVSHQQGDGASGGRIVIHAGVTQSHQALKSDQSGTSLFIKDLFYNTPARLKFIKSATSEKNALRRVILSFILTHPQTSFTVKWDDQDKKVYPCSGDHKNIRQQRIKELFGAKAKESSFFHFEAEYEGHQVEGFFSKTSTKGSSYKKHFLFANDRLFTDRQIHQTILRSMEGLYPQGESGHYVVFLKIPPHLLDVNVHPHKTLIKFYKMQVITGLVSSEIKKLHQQNQMTSQGTQNDLDLRGSDFSARSSLQESSQSFTKQYDQNYRGSYGPQNSTEGRTETTFWPTAQQTNTPLTIVSIEEKSFLVNKSKLIDHLSLFFQEQDDNDNEFIPLLITEPFAPSFINEKCEEKLKSWGFICDIVDNYQVMLRAYHPIYELNFAKQLIHILLETSFKLSPSQIGTLYLSESNLSLLTKEPYFLNHQNSFMRLIDDELCSSLFTSQQ